MALEVQAPPLVNPAAVQTPALQLPLTHWALQEQGVTEQVARSVVGAHWLKVVLQLALEQLVPHAQAAQVPASGDGTHLPPEQTPLVHSQPKEQLEQLIWGVGLAGMAAEQVPLQL